MANYIWMKKEEGEATPVDPSYVEEAEKQGYKRCAAPDEGPFVDAGAETEVLVDLTADKVNNMRKNDIIKFANSQGVEIDVTAPVAEIRESLIEALGLE